MPKAFDIGRWLIVAGCAYEICAVPHRTPVPTITALVRGGQRHWAGKLGMVVWLAVWVHHFVAPEHFRK